MSDDDPRWGSKEWIRYHWDEEYDTAPKQVLLLKAIHEYHIFIPGLIAGGVAAGSFWYAGASLLQVLSSLFTGVAGGYALFLQIWWCSTLAE